MAIFLNENRKVLVQGMTGSEGTKHTRRMVASGTEGRRRRQPAQGRQKVDVDGTSSGLRLGRPRR